MKGVGLCGELKQLDGFVHEKNAFVYCREELDNVNGGMWVFKTKKQFTVSTGCRKGGLLWAGGREGGNLLAK